MVSAVTVFAAAFLLASIAFAIGIVKFSVDGDVHSPRSERGSGG